MDPLSNQLLWNSLTLFSSLLRWLLPSGLSIKSNTTSYSTTSERYCTVSAWSLPRVKRPMEFPVKQFGAGTLCNGLLVMRDMRAPSVDLSFLH